RVGVPADVDGDRLDHGGGADRAGEGPAESLVERGDLPGDGDGVDADDGADEDERAAEVVEADAGGGPPGGALGGALGLAAALPLGGAFLPAQPGLFEDLGAAGLRLGVTHPAFRAGEASGLRA